jgi:hypothetical protein
MLEHTLLASSKSFSCIFSHSSFVSSFTPSLEASRFSKLPSRLSFFFGTGVDAASKMLFDDVSDSGALHDFFFSRIGVMSSSPSFTSFVSVFVLPLLREEKEKEEEEIKLSFVPTFIRFSISH